MSLDSWVNPDAYQRASPIPGSDSDRLCQLARDYQIYLSVGLAEKEGEKLYDSVILVDENGSILLKHRKINLLTELMTRPYTPGHEVNAVQTKYGKIGMLICADTFLDENLERMAALQPDFVLAPFGWAAEEEEWPEHGKTLTETVCNAAKVIGAPVIGTDLVGVITHGPWSGRVYGGQSVAVDQKGNILATAIDRDCEVKMVSINT